MEEETGVTPEALKTRPQLDPETLHSYGLWKELAGSRNYSFAGSESIPFSEVFCYGVAHGYTRAELPDLWDAVSKVDAVWHQVRTEIQKAQASKK